MTLWLVPRPGFHHVDSDGVSIQPFAARRRTGTDSWFGTVIANIGPYRDSRRTARRLPPRDVPHRRWPGHLSFSANCSPSLGAPEFLQRKRNVLYRSIDSDSCEWISCPSLAFPQRSLARPPLFAATIPRRHTSPRASRPDVQLWLPAVSIDASRWNLSPIGSKRMAPGPHACSPMGDAQASGTLCSLGHGRPVRRRDRRRCSFQRYRGGTIYPSNPLANRQAHRHVPRAP